MTATVLRQRGGHDGGKVGMVELFFDLVFVFAVTQLSHSLLANLDLAGALQTGLLLLAVWWVWIYTSWATNFLDPDTVPVRLMLFGLMFGGLLMSSALPNAFAGHGLAFAGAYVAMQVGRSAFMVWALREASPGLRRNFQRILAWLMLSAVFWMIGGLSEGGQRVGWWALALGLEIASPMLLFWVPGMGRSSTRDWTVDAHHLAERCALFVIIALGESLLITGATFAEQAWNTDTTIAFVAAFVGSVAMWWIYFNTGAEHATRRFANADDPGRVARIAYTYLHVIIVAGIIVCAVADELVLVHPGHAEAAGLAAILGGPALYLIGTASFKWVTNDRRLPPLSHLVGLLLIGLLAIAGFAHWVSPLPMACATSVVMVIVAVWESRALRKVIAIH